jgi:hypothetical protein
MAGNAVNDFAVNDFAVDDFAVDDFAVNVLTKAVLNIMAKCGPAIQVYLTDPRPAFFERSS